METIKSILADPAIQEWLRTGLVALIGAIFAYISKKNADINTDTQTHLTKEMKLKDIQATVQRAVFAVGVSIGDDLKAAAADGKLTSTEKEQLFSTARSKVLEELSAEAKLFIQTQYPNQEAFIKNSIEAAYAFYKAVKNGTGNIDSLKKN